MSMETSPRPPLVGLSATLHGFGVHETYPQSGTYVTGELEHRNLEESNYVYWRDHIGAHETTSTTPIAEFITPHTYLGSPYDIHIQTAESPKLGKPISADVIILRKAPFGTDVFLFIGDGLFSVNKPPEALLPILKEYDCMDRPDALPAALMRDARFMAPLFGQMPPDPRKFIRSLNYQFNRLYRELGVPLDLVDKSTLPSIIGTAIVFDPYSIRIASIGDPVNWIQDTTGMYQSILPTQNIGIDGWTRAKINQILEANPDIHTVTEARQTEEFKKWLIFTFQEKINKPGGVSVINGLDLPSRIPYLEIPTDYVHKLITGTDGLTLGMDTEAAVQEFSTTPINRLQQYIASKPTTQKAGYSEETCTQEKEVDDFAAVQITFKNALEDSEFASLLNK